MQQNKYNKKIRNSEERDYRKKHKKTKKRVRNAKWKKK